MLLLTLVLYLFSAAEAFFPSDFREAHFGNGGISHESQTRQAYEELVKEFWPDITTSTNMKNVLKVWIKANEDVDDDQEHSALHFDGENFEGGQNLLVANKELLVDQLRKNQPEAARKQLGRSLHTVQDFYSHTNWVENGNKDINRDLGKADKTLDYAPWTVATCGQCSADGALSPLEDGCLDCQQNLAGFTQLTSGYYLGEDSPPEGTEIPDYKCRHGGPFDSSVGYLGYIADLFGDTKPGINKDSLDCFWSPHNNYHMQAADLSIKATKQFIKDIIDEYELTEKEKKVLFGVGSTLAFAIDTTGSMSGIIASVRQQAIQIAESRKGTKDEPIDYVLAPFNDPTTGPVTKTTDLEEFKSAINSLTAGGGDDCPELLTTGVLDAMSVMDGPADIFTFSDIWAKDKDRGSEMVAIANSKQISIRSYDFRSGCVDYKKRDLQSKRDVVADLSGEEYYKYITTATGGSYHVLSYDEIDTVSTLVDSLTSSDSVGILKVQNLLNGTGTVSYDLPIDSALSKVNLWLRADSIKMTLYLPDGTELEGSSQDYTLTDLAQGQTAEIRAPSSGGWKIKLTGSGDFALDVNGVSSLTFDSFDFVALKGRPGHSGYRPIDTAPAYNHDVAAIARLDGDFKSATFSLRTADYVKALDVFMEAGSGEDGQPSANAFWGQMRLVPGTLFAYCEGTDNAGKPYQRVLSTAFAPILSNTTETGINNTDIVSLRKEYLATHNTTDNTTTTSTTATTTTTTTTSSYLNTTSITTTTSVIIHQNNTSSATASTTTTTPTTSNSLNTTSITTTISTTAYQNATTSTASPTTSTITSSGNASIPSPTHTWPHFTCPLFTNTDTIHTHSAYLPFGWSPLPDLTLTTTSQCPFTKTSVDSNGNTATITSSSVSIVTVTIPGAARCSTCIGPNYPGHVGQGPWDDEDVSVAVYGASSTASSGVSPGYGKHSIGSSGDPQASASALTWASWDGGRPSQVAPVVSSTNKPDASLAGSTWTDWNSGAPSATVSATAGVIAADTAISRSNALPTSSWPATGSHSGPIAQFTGKAAMLELKIKGLMAALAIGFGLTALL